MSTTKQTFEMMETAVAAARDGDMTDAEAREIVDAYFELIEEELNRIIRKVKRNVDLRGKFTIIRE